MAAIDSPIASLPSLGTRRTRLSPRNAAVPISSAVACGLSRSRRSALASLSCRCLDISAVLSVTDGEGWLRGTLPLCRRKRDRRSQEATSAQRIDGLLSRGQGHPVGLPATPNDGVTRADPLATCPGELRSHPASDVPAPFQDGLDVFGFLSRCPPVCSMPVMFPTIGPADGLAMSCELVSAKRPRRSASGEAGEYGSCDCVRSRAVARLRRERLP